MFNTIWFSLSYPQSTLVIILPKKHHVISWLIAHKGGQLESSYWTSLLIFYDFMWSALLLVEMGLLVQFIWMFVPVSMDFGPNCVLARVRILGTDFVLCMHFPNEYLLLAINSAYSFISTSTSVKWYYTLIKKIIESTERFLSLPQELSKDFLMQHWFIASPACWFNEF